MSQRVETNARALFLTRSSQPENGHLRQNNRFLHTFTEEIGTYMRCWESHGDLPPMIEIFVSFRSFRCAPLAKRHNISITRGRSPGLSQERM
jgi:hypothetical protein